MEGKMRRVVENDESKTVGLDDIDPNKIYGMDGDGTIYKAHKDGDNWGFLSMSSSNERWISNKTLAKLIASELSEKVYEFETMEEFCKWALRQD
jgi:hypothetical protein